MLLHKCLCERQAQAGALLALGGFISYLLVRRESLWDILNGNTDTAIDNLHNYTPSGSRPGPHSNLTTIRSELRGIRKQIQEYLLQLATVGFYRGQAASQIVLNGLVSAFRTHADHWRNGVNQLYEPYRLFVEFIYTRFDLGNVEQIVDQI